MAAWPYMTGFKFVETRQPILQPAAEFSRLDLLMFGVTIEGAPSHTEIFRGSCMFEPGIDDLKFGFSEIPSPSVRKILFERGVFNDADVIVRSHSSPTTDRPAPGFGSPVMNGDAIKYTFSGHQHIRLLAGTAATHLKQLFTCS
jgi:hypothetical protein